MTTNTTDMNTTNTTNSAIQATPLTDSLATKEVMNTSLAALGEKLGQFKAYDSQLPIAEIVGTRVVKCLYQASAKDGTKAQENAYTRLPVKHLTEEGIVAKVAELSPYILNWLQGIEDVMIKADHKAGATQVFTEYLSLDKLIAHLEEAGSGGRLNKAKIEEWFTANLEDELAGLFAAKLGYTIETLDSATEHELAKLAKVVGAYKAKFATLASPKCYFPEEDCKAMIAVIEKVEAAKNSLLGARFIARLDKMMSSEDDMLLAL